MKEVLVGNPDEMREFAAQYILLLTERRRVGRGAATVVALSGELGAGKTTFAQAVAKNLGVEETVNSPTFVIEKIYVLQDQKWQRLVHIDAYRLKSADELRALGFDELVLDANSIILIEWPEHVEGAIPKGAQRISITIKEDGARTISYDS